MKATFVTESNKSDTSFNGEDPFASSVNKQGSSMEMPKGNLKLGTVNQDNSKTGIRKTESEQMKKGRLHFEEKKHHAVRFETEASKYEKVLASPISENRSNSET